MGRVIVGEQVGRTTVARNGLPPILQQCVRTRPVELVRPRIGGESYGAIQVRNGVLRAIQPDQDLSQVIQRAHIVRIGVDSRLKPLQRGIDVAVALYGG